MRYPIIHQHDATDCGPAVLAMIAAHHKKRVSLARLRELAGTDRRGTTLAGLSAAAEQVGFHPSPVRATLDALKDVPLPAVAHFQNHFVVLYKTTRRHLIIGDPALGLRKLTRDQFLKAWTGVMLLLTPTIRLRDAAGSKSGPARLCSLLLPHSRLFLDACLAAVSMTILGLSSSFFIQVLVDVVLVQGQTPTLNWLAAGMLLVTLARAGFLAVRSYLLAHLSMRIDAETMLGYHRHLLGLPLSFFTSRRTGEILSRLNDAIKIRIAAGTTTLSVVVDTLLVVITGIIMMCINWKLTLQSLQFVPALVCAVWLFSGPMRRHQRGAMEKSAEVESQIVETIGAIQEIKAFRAEPRVQLKTEARFAEMQNRLLDAQKLAGHSTAVSSLFAGLSALGLLWFGGHQVIAGTMTAGQLMAFYTLLGTILGPVERLAGANQSIQDAMIAADRLSDVLDVEPESRKQRSSAISEPLKGTIEFQNVSFAYGSRPPVFEGVNIRVEAGECAGIVGDSGCGKTTLVRLIARLFDPQSGRVLIDGVDVRDYTFERLRRDIAYVPQDIVLLNGSVAENIRLGRPDALPQEIRDAGKRARMQEFVGRLPHGYDTSVGERGLSLSGGERQRIAIARAILAEPSILILDEPTSHLDSQSELAVQELLDSRRGLRTTIVISHRPIHADRLIELQARYTL
jgi:ATP-binding cassette, subfamily C, bacteriocin exporter